MQAQPLRDLRWLLGAAFALVLACLASPASAGRDLPPGAAPIPPDVRVGITDTSGWVYTDKQGFTLYTWPRGDDPMKSNCTDQRYIRAAVNQSDVKYYLPDADKRPTCVEQ